MDEIERVARQAEAALEDDDFVRALAALDQLEALGADPFMVHLLRARTLLGMDSFAEAMAEAESAVNLIPTEEHGHLLLAHAAWRAGFRSKAQAAFESAVRFSDREPAVLTEYALFMAEERGPALGLEAARRAIEADEMSGMAWAAMALAQWRMHQYQGARESVARALKLEPSNALAQSLTFRLLQAEGSDEQAAALVEVMQDNPDMAEFVAAAKKDLSRRAALRRVYELETMQQRIVHGPRRPLLVRAAQLPPGVYLVVALLIALVGVWYRSPGFIVLAAVVTVFGLLQRR